MVRYLEGSLSDTTVVSVGGARVQHFTSEVLSRHVSDTCPYLVLMHIGTNDVNKSECFPCSKPCIMQKCLWIHFLDPYLICRISFALQ